MDKTIATGCGVNAEVKAAVIDKDACLAQLKDLTGTTWFHYAYTGSEHDFHCHAPDGSARLSISTGADGKWRWLRSTTIGKGVKYDITADVRQTFDSLDAAIADLQAFQPLDPVTVAGAVWHQGSNLYGKPDQRVAVFGTEAAVITPCTDGFSWRREWPQAQTLTQALCDAGCGYLTVHDLSGHCPTFEQAAQAAATACDQVRAALKAWIAEDGPQPMDLPNGAAERFAISLSMSGQPWAHLEGAVGDGVADRLVLADYLEGVAAQLRRDREG